MKQVIRSKRFLKLYQKRIAQHGKLDSQFEERFRLFLAGIRGAPINDHALTDKMEGLRAFSITGDVRVIYRETDNAYELLDVGTHNQVYR